MNISGPAAVAKPEMLFYAPGDLTVTVNGISAADEVTIADRYLDALKPFLEDCRKELV